MDDIAFQAPVLTPRERQCLTLPAEGLRGDAIAVTQAVAIAIRHNLLSGENG